MRLQIKQKFDRRWHDIEIEKLKGQPIVEYMIDNKLPCICAVWMNDDKDPSLFMSNDHATVEQYRDKGVSFHTSEAYYVLGGIQVSEHLIETFPGSTVVEIKSTEGEQDELFGENNSVVKGRGTHKGH